jgi:hypothetical protein
MFEAKDANEIIATLQKEGKKIQHTHEWIGDIAKSHNELAAWMQEISKSINMLAKIVSKTHNIPLDDMKDMLKKEDPVPDLRVRTNQ